ncbi:hypothetical protein WDU94_012486 [Cyamophila willieti]
MCSLPVLALVASCLVVVGVSCTGVCMFDKKVPAAEIDSAFRKHNIVPDVIDKAPEKYLFVKYRTENAVHYVRLGTQIHPMIADEAPEDIEWEPEEGAYYSLFHLGPNANGYQKKWNEANFLHFCKVNIQGNDWQHTGHVIADYVGSRPFEEFGNPYYVYLVYKQPKLIHFEEANDVADYVKYDWDLRAFLKKHGINNLVAGNFYTSKSDWSKLSSLLTFKPEDYETVPPKML